MYEDNYSIKLQEEIDETKDLLIIMEDSNGPVGNKIEAIERKRERKGKNLDTKMEIELLKCVRKTT